MTQSKYKIQISIAKNSKNKDVLISDAVKGEKYYCYDCDSVLIPRKGNKIQHHYGHKTKTDCKGETWEHKYCKKILSKYLNNIHFEVLCNNCEYNHSYNYDEYDTKEEFPYNEYKIDLGVLLNGKLNAAIEILHSHKVEKNKQDDIIYNNIDFVEITTKKIFSELENIKENKKVILKCEPVNICKKCEEYERFLYVIKYVKKYPELFENIHISPNIIEIKNCTFSDMIFKEIKTKYDNINDLIRIKVVDHKNNGCDCSSNNVERKCIIQNCSIYLLGDENIVAGSFACNIFQKYLSKIDTNITCDWEPNDIDIWLYDQNGLHPRRFKMPFFCSFNT